jgi:hypothetical protein
VTFPTTSLIEFELLHVRPAITRFPAVVGAVSVQAEPEEELVWLQMVCDAETKAMAPHAGVEPSRARTRTSRFIRDLLFRHAHYDDPQQNVGYDAFWRLTNASD